MNSIAIRPLPDFLTEKAEKELNEVAKRIPSELQILRDWLQTQPHLISKMDDQFLVGFLRGCKYSIERSKEKLDSYYTLRTAIPEFFSERDPTHPNFIELFHKGALFFLPIPHPDGPCIILSKPGVFDVQRDGYINFMKYALMVVDRNFFEDDYCNICGQHLVVDMRGFTMDHAKQVTIPIIKKVTELLKDGYPARHKGIHFIYFPQAFIMLVTIAKSFLPAKIVNKIYFHSDLKSLYECIPAQCLPTEYGGDAGTLEDITSNFYKKWLADPEWFIEDAKYGSDESKRIGSPKTAGELFGVDGSFRKLDID